MTSAQHRELPDQRSTRSQRDRAVERLHAVGLGRLSDSFLLPGGRADRSTAPHYARTARVRWRAHEDEFFVRAADVPFDLLSGRPGTPARVGGFFSLGPGLTIDGLPHPAVLNVQLEGPADTIYQLRGAAEEVVRAVATEVREIELVLPNSAWTRICLAGILKNVSASAPDAVQ